MSTRTPAHAVSGAEGRPARRARACEILTEARKSADLTMLALAADVGCSQQAIQRMEDESDTGHPVHADVLLAPLVVKEAARAMCREAGMIAIEIPPAAIGSEALARVAAIARESGEVVSAAIESLADGVITDSENERICAEIDDAIASMAKLRKSLELARGQTVASVRSIGVRK